MKLKHLHYGWVTVVIAACVLAIHVLPIYTFGIFLVPLTEGFDWERGALSGAYSMGMLLTGFLAILSGRLSDKYGPRILVTLNGLLTGIGFLLLSQISSLWQVYLIWGLFGIAGGCCYIPILSTIPRWFVKKRGIAMGLTVTGIGLGGLISPPLAQWLISSYDWRQSYLILGLISFIIVIPLAQFLKHSPQRIGLKPYGENGTIEDKQPLTAAGLSLIQAIKTSRFWILGSILFCFFFSVGVVVVHITPYAINIGILAIVAASITSIIAGISVIGRLSMGFISDKVGGRLVLIACLTSATLALIWLLFAKEIWMLYIFAVIFGVCYGGVVLLQTVITVEFFGLGSLGMVLGGVMLYATVGMALGPPLAGSIFDITGSYSLAFLICVAICALASILSLILLKARGWRGSD